MRRECEASLRRLKVDTIDLYQIHWPEPEEDIEEGWATLAKLQQEGKVRWIGVSNFNAGADGAVPRDRADHVAAAAVFGDVARRSRAETLPYCQQHGIGVIVYSPMKIGLLTGTMTRERVAAFPADDFRQARAGVSGAEPDAQPGAGGQDEGDRRAARADARAKWRLRGRCGIRR